MDKAMVSRPENSRAGRGASNWNSMDCVRSPAESLTPTMFCAACMQRARVLGNTFTLVRGGLLYSTTGSLVALAMAV